MFASKKKKEKKDEKGPVDQAKRKRRDSLSIVRRMGTEKPKAKRKDMHTSDSNTNLSALENSRESFDDHEPSPRVVEFNDSPSRPTPPRASVTMSEGCLTTKYYDDVQDADEEAKLNRARSFKIRDQRRMEELVDFANNHVGNGVVSPDTFGKDLSDGLGFYLFFIYLFIYFLFIILSFFLLFLTFFLCQFSCTFCTSLQDKCPESIPKTPNTKSKKWITSMLFCVFLPQTIASRFLFPSIPLSPFSVFFLILTRNNSKNS